MAKTTRKAKTAESAPALRYMVPVVRSTFLILEEVAQSGAIGLNEITVQTGVSKSTAFRIVTSLVHLGYMMRDASGKYYVSAKVGDLVKGAPALEALRHAALPHMLALRDKFGETVNLGLLELDKVSYAEVVPSEYALRLHERPGATVPAHASSLGRAILAYSPAELVDSLIRGRELQALTRTTITDRELFLKELRAVRERGYALDRGEISPLATCVGVPILDGNGMALAAISISGPTSRFNPKKDSPAIESLILAAGAISRELRQQSAPAEPVRASTRAGR